MKKQSQPSGSETFATLILAVPMLLLGLGVFAFFVYMVWSLIFG